MDIIFFCFQLSYEIWDMLVETCNSMYLVGGSVCINEQLLPFRGRCAFRQYMPKNKARTETKCG